MTQECYGNNGNVSLKQRVYDLLNHNPDHKPKQLAHLLQIDYKAYSGYLRKLRCEYKHTLQNERGSIPSSFHNWQAFLRMPSGGPSISSVDVRAAAVGSGWLETRARNRWLLWQDRLGRVQWHTRGAILLWVRKPVKLNKVYQLVCNAFGHTFLVSDAVLDGMLQGITFTGAHYVYDAGIRLPKRRIDLFKESNGFILKVGDKSHPSSIELEVCYPGWGLRNEALFSRLEDTLTQLLAGGSARELKPGPGGYIQ